MENHDNKFNTICRICLRYGKEEKMVSLIENSSESGLSFYGALIEKLTTITVNQNEYYPTKICSDCKKFLEEISAFNFTSKNSDRKLAKLINFSIERDLSGDMVKEVLCQYTLFNQNFPDETKSSVTCSEEVYFLAHKHEGKQTNNNKEDEKDSDSIKHTSQHSNTEYTGTDNVDTFLFSIETLVTTEIDHGPRAQTSKEVLNKKINKRSKNKGNTDQDFTCNVCHRTLANPSTYKNHMQRHGICRYVCDQCGKGFPILAELTQHQIYRHGIDSRYECDQCSFKAARRLELIEHLRLHTGERPFTCEKCGLTFRRKAIYKNHLKSHGEKTIQCDHCPRKFYRRSEMLAHSNNVHDRLYMFLCKICNVTYAMAKTVRKHMLVKHGVPRHMQGRVIRINKNEDCMLFKS